MSASAVENVTEVLEHSTSGTSTSRLPAKRKSVLPPRKGMDLVGELAGLRKRLEVLDQEDGGSRMEGPSSGGVEDRLRRLTMGKAANGEEAEEAGDGVDEVNGHDAGGGASASDLDRRLASLEEMIGTSGEGLDQVCSRACSSACR
jgi:nuclear migration protein JNM1